MKVQEAFVTLEKSEEIFSIIEKNLLDEPNTQVFIENQIYENLCRTIYKSHVYSGENYGRCDHYYQTFTSGEEQFLRLAKDGYYAHSDTLASFVSNCKGYKQLVQFRSSRIKYYKHYYVGFQQLLLIHYKI